VVGPTGTSTQFIGATYTFNVPGKVYGVRFYRQWGAENSCYGMFWTDTHNKYLRGFSYHQLAASAARWNNVWFHPTIRIVPNDLYRVGVLFFLGDFYRTNNVLSAVGTPVFHGHIGLVSSWQTSNLDPANPGTSITQNTNANAVDVLFQPDV